MKYKQLSQGEYFIYQGQLYIKYKPNKCLLAKKKGLIFKEITPETEVINNG